MTDPARPSRFGPPAWARLFRCGSVAAVLALAVPATAAAGASSVPALGNNPWTMCAKATNHIERTEGIPRQLLRAISKAESGRFHRGKQVVMAWPWTVMAEGRGRYLETKAEAVAEVKALRARGVKNIDVGCMQVNLHYHPHAFASIEDAFDPLTNVTYGASFLKTLATEHGSWARAAAYYHSQNPARYRTYRAKIREIWATEREKYLLALDQLRAEQTAALSLASLIRIDAPLPAAPTASVSQAAATLPPRSLPAAAALLRGTATASASAETLAFHRAGPVRAQVVADLR